MASTYTLHLWWKELLMNRLLHEHVALTRGYREEMRRGWELPRLDRAQAEEQAAAMVERWNRMFLRALRALQETRRHAPPAAVTIQNTGQVNVGLQQQVNVAAPGE